MILAGSLLLASSASAAVTVKIEPGADAADNYISDVCIDVLTSWGYTIVLGEEETADVNILLRTSEETAASANASDEGNASEGNEEEAADSETGEAGIPGGFTDGRDLPTNPIFSMSHILAESDTVFQYSQTLAQCIADSYAQATLSDPVTLLENESLGGRIPSVLIKVDALHNQDSLLTNETEAGQAWIAYVISTGIRNYFEENPSAVLANASQGEAIQQTASQLSRPETVSRPSTTSEGSHGSTDGTLSPSESGAQSISTEAEEARNLISTALGSTYSNLPAIGSWAVFVNDLKHNVSAYAPPTAADGMMQSASLIKLFIMGAVYERYDELSAAYGASTLDGYLSPMITVSDNDAANSLVSILGGGDNAAGMAAVNSFCQAHGYTSTSMGRLLLASRENGDNYTSVVDVGRFLSEVYRSVYSEPAASGGSIWSNPQTSSSTLAHGQEMFSLLCQQQVTHKIPSGMPEGVKTANKTGELSDVENDAAIIYDTDNGNDLVIVFMSENLTASGTAQEAIATGARTIYDYYH